MIHLFFTFLPAFLILIWLVFFYNNNNKKKSYAKRFLIISLSVALIVLTIIWSYSNYIYTQSHIIESIWVFTSLSVYPLYYYYLRLLVLKEEVDFRLIWLMIPAFIFALFSAIIYMMMSPQEIETFTNEILYKNRLPSGNYSILIRLQLLRMQLFELSFIIGIVLTAIYGMRLFIKYREKILTFYQNVQQGEFSVIETPFLLLTISAFMAVTSNIIGYRFFFNNPYLLALPFIIHPIVFCLASCRRNVPPLSNTNLTKEDQFQTVDKNTQEGEEDIYDELSYKYEELYKNMEHLLINEQIFRDPELRLNDLALKLGTNRTYVSQLINKKTNSNFSEYINLHRIEYAKKSLSSENAEHLTLDEIALKSGFSSQSSFYRVFMKIEGTSPAKYRMQKMQKIIHLD